MSTLLKSPQSQERRRRTYVFTDMKTDESFFKVPKPPHRRSKERPKKRLKSAPSERESNSTGSSSHDPNEAMKDYRNMIDRNLVTCKYLETKYMDYQRKARIHKPENTSSIMKAKTAWYQMYAPFHKELGIGNKFFRIVDVHNICPSIPYIHTGQSNTSNIPPTTDSSPNQLYKFSVKQESLEQENAIENITPTIFDSSDELDRDVSAQDKTVHMDICSIPAPSLNEYIHSPGGSDGLHQIALSDIVDNLDDQSSVLSLDNAGGASSVEFDEDDGSQLEVSDIISKIDDHCIDEEATSIITSEDIQNLKQTKSSMRTITTQTTEENVLSLENQEVHANFEQRIIQLGESTSKRSLPIPTPQRDMEPMLPNEVAQATLNQDEPPSQNVQPHRTEDNESQVPPIHRNFSHNEPNIRLINVDDNAPARPEEQPSIRFTCLGIPENSMRQTLLIPTIDVLNSIIALHNHIVEHGIDITNKDQLTQFMYEKANLHFYDFSDRT